MNSCLNLYQYVLTAGLLLGIGYAQVPGDSLFVQPVQVIGDLPAMASLEVDSEGNLILLEATQSKAHKYFVQWAYDSTLSIGGKSNRSEGFLNLVNASARNRQNIYLLDDIARRLVILSADFQILGEVNFFAMEPAPGAFIDVDEIYPQRFDMAGTGEAFVLNQLDNRVYKLNLAGEVIERFGGLDFGAGNLNSPVDIALNDGNEVWISDTSRQQFSVFDFFGVFRYVKLLDAGFRWNRFTLADQLLICFNSTEIWVEHLPSGRHRKYKVPGVSALQDVHFSKEFIYLLLEHEVRIYKR